MEYSKRASGGVVNVTLQELPLSCPKQTRNPGDMHPRVYLQFNENKATCPYCGTEYIIKS